MAFSCTTNEYNEDPEDHNKYSFGSIPVLFLPVVAYYAIQICLSLASAIRIRWLYQQAWNIKRTSQSIEIEGILCCHLRPSWTAIMRDYHQGFLYAHISVWISGLATSVSLHRAACERRWNWLEHHVFSISLKTSRQLTVLPVTPKLSNCRSFVFSGPFYAFVVGVLLKRSPSCPFRNRPNYIRWKRYVIYKW